MHFTTPALFLLLSVVSLCANTLELTQEEKTFIKEHPMLRVQNESTWAPIDFRENGQEKGFAVNYIQLLCAKAGFKLKFIHGRSWGSYLQMLQDKELDLISNMKITSQRKNYTLFTSHPTVELFNGILQRKSTPALRSMKDLENKTVAVVKGYYQEEIFHYNFPRIRLKLAEDTLDAMRLVADGQADATIEYHSVLNYNINRYFFSQLHSIPLREERYFPPSSQFIGIRDDWPVLKHILDKTMLHMSEEEIRLLRKKWLSGIQEEKPILNEDEQLYVKKNNFIRFCCDPDWLPIEKIEGENHIGITADYLNKISGKLKLRFELVPTSSWQQSLDFVKTKKCDFLSAAMPSPERKKYLNFSSAYLDLPLVITTRSDNFLMNSLKSISHKKIGIVQATVYEKILRRDYPDAEFVYVRSAYEGLRQVDEGQIYAYADTLEATSQQLRTSSFSHLKISSKLAQKIGLSFAVRTDEPLLYEMLEKGIHSLSNTEKKEIYDKWAYIAVEQEMDFSLLLKVLGIGSLLSLFFIYRYRLTLKYNNKLLTINKELERLNLQLEELSQTDQLTQLSNRRHLDTVLSSEVMRARRYQSSFCVILIDIDFFKKINDTYGHQKGDLVLQETAHLLRDNSRKIDTVGRWGGEEFLIILPQTNLNQATFLAEKLRNKIKTHDFGLRHTITASFGVTAYNNGHDSESSLLSRADANLYEAKKTNRDKVVSA